jgi:hypothetical protein
MIIKAIILIILIVAFEIYLEFSRRKYLKDFENEINKCTNLLESFNFKKFEEKIKKIKQIIPEEPIHNWFELSYAQYLTIPRSILQSMPIEWQQRFVSCLGELDNTIDWKPSDGCYWVTLKDSKGRFVKDPLGDYDRGRRKIPFKND